MGIPETIRLAVELGIITVLLAFAARIARAVWVYPLLLALAIGEAIRLEVIRAPWAFDSLWVDAPWLSALRLAAVQVGVLLLVPALLRGAPGRLVCLAVVSPVLAGSPGLRRALAEAIPSPRERAGLVLAASGISMVVPAISPSLGLLGGLDLEVAAVGCAGLGALAWGSSRASGPAPASAASGSIPPDRRGAIVAALVPTLGAALVAWLAMAGGVLEWLATGLEQSAVLIPRVRDLALTAAATLLGALGDEGTLAVVFDEGFQRALSLDGEALPHLVRLGLSLGSGLTLLVATGASLRFGVPFWLLQVAWAWYWSS